MINTTVPTTLPHTTYAEFYNDGSNDPYSGRFAPVLGPFDIDPANAAASTRPADLLNQLTSATTARLPSAILALVHGTEDDANHPGWIECYHKIFRFPARFGMTATRWDNLNFAISGDIVRGQCAPVALGAQWFYQTANNLHAPTEAAVEAAIVANTNDDLVVGPYNADDAGTEIVRVRNVVYLPSPYIPIFLENRMLPKEAYLRVSQAMAADGVDGDCEPVLKWLRLAMTKNGHNDFSVLRQDRTTLPPPDSDLISFLMDLVERDLPGLSAASGNAGASLVASSIGDLVYEHQEDRRSAERRRKDADTKSPDKFWGDSINNVINLCQVSSMADLPPLYAKISSSAARAQRLEHQRLMSLAVATHAPGYKIIVTPSLHSKLINLEFVLQDKDDLRSGFTCFLFGQFTPGQRQAAARKANTYDMIVGAAAAPSLADAATITTDDNIEPPSRYAEGRSMGKRTLGAIALWFGDNHPLCEEWAEFLIEWEQREEELEFYETTDPRMKKFLATLILRWAQLQVSYWIERQWSKKTNVRVPDLTKVFRKIDLGKSWEPRLPEHIMARLFLKSKKSGRDDRDTDADKEKSPRNGDPVKPPDKQKTSSASVNMAYKITMFGTYAILKCRVKDVLAVATKRLPKSPHDPAGKQDMCVSFHVKGQCNNNCKCLLDHRAHADADDEKLLAWCKECYKCPTLEQVREARRAKLEAAKGGANA